MFPPHMLDPTASRSAPCECMCHAVSHLKSYVLGFLSDIGTLCRECTLSIELDQFKYHRGRASVCLSIYLVCLTSCLAICVSICLSFSLALSLTSQVAVWLYVLLSIQQSIHPSIYLHFKEFVNTFFPLLQYSSID